ncbi:ribosome small subunit-dependent GTPase A [Neptunicella marina]|uniref:Small ribosomal subunit biogenesis GTPase RsgA n=1 Tax=Neptunicella marina TaxID=2125989 RepID=A0A8J6LXH4_9ALTE|nr:ribosome small subunit-dependent GTPase A [Neptunicella marina]MBC3764795.1 ribosome small subunit-dependent GTPase A [Neptunicella marina]
MSTQMSLTQLGWQAFFQLQLNLEELQQNTIARVIAHHRSEYVLRSEYGFDHLAITPSLPHLTVGDWLLLDEEKQFVRMLERKSLFSRKAAGAKLAEQLIVANVDTVLIVCSLNHDFNLSRIERYLTLVHEAGAEPVVVLTKLDLCDDAQRKFDALQALDPLLQIEMVNGLDATSCANLLSLCKAGKTISLLGSSGVGKSTLLNTLMGNEVQKTSGIREDDSKGRHTTTARSMHFMPNGAVLIDTPGMRELQLADCEQGIRQAFADIDALAEQCRFADCLHFSEPNCAVLKAIDDGLLDLRRLHNYHKLLREQAHNASSLQQIRAKDKQFGRMVKNVVKDSRLFKRGY